MQQFLVNTSNAKIVDSKYPTNTSLTGLQYWYVTGGISSASRGQMSRTIETDNNYRRRALALIKQAKTELRTDWLEVFQLIAWFLNHHDTWAPATIRQYRSALTLLVTDAVESRQLVAVQGTSLVGKLRGYFDQDGRQAAPRAQRNLLRPKKRRVMSPTVAIKLVESLGKRNTKTAKLGQLIVVAGLEIGVRPCEWGNVEVHKDFCQVRNAKNTNDRANGTKRTILIPPNDLTPRFLAVVHEITRRISTGAPWKNMERRVNYSLKRASVEIGLKTPVSLSTLRHVAIARWKCVFSPDEVAALAGHASNATAVYHYGRRRSGRKWPPLLVRPHLPSVAVRDRFRSYDRRTISPKTN